MILSCMVCFDIVIRLQLVHDHDHVYVCVSPLSCIYIATCS